MNSLVRERERVGCHFVAVSMRQSCFVIDTDTCLLQTLEPTPLHKTKSDEKCIDMDDIYPDTRSPTHTPRDTNHSPTPLTSSPIHTPHNLSRSSTHLPDSPTDSFPTRLIPPSPHSCHNLQRNEVSNSSCVNGGV